MAFDPDIHQRRSIRLRGYDYASPGAYFVTICVQGKECLFGEAQDGEAMLSEAGRMVKRIWRQLFDRFSNLIPDEFIIMPNHFHAIISVGAPLVGAQSFDGAAPLLGAQSFDGAAPLLGAQSFAPNVNIKPCMKAGNTTSEHRGHGDDTQRAGTRLAPTVGDIVGAFKSLTPNAYIHGVHQSA